MLLVGVAGNNLKCGCINCARNLICRLVVCVSYCRVSVTEAVVGVSVAGTCRRRTPVPAAVKCYWCFNIASAAGLCVSYWPAGVVQQLLAQLNPSDPLTCLVALQLLQVSALRTMQLCMGPRS